MDDRTTRNLIDAVRWLKRNRIERKIGIVRDDLPFTVEISGVERTDCKHLGSYTPAVDDRVWCTRVGQEPWLIHGDIV